MAISTKKKGVYEREEENLLELSWSYGWMRVVLAWASGSEVSGERVRVRVAKQVYESGLGFACVAEGGESTLSGREVRSRRSEGREKPSSDSDWASPSAPLELVLV